MTLLFCDSFDHYTTATQLALKWGGSAPLMGGISSGRNGNCLVLNASNQAVTRVLSASSVTIITGVAWRQTITISTNQIIGYLDSAAASQITARLNSNGTVSIVRGAVNGTVLATSTSGGSTPAITAGIWHYVEFKATIDDVSGYAELKIDGVTYCSYSGDTQQTANANIQYVRFINDGNTTNFDDLYICDSTGTNSNFLGDIKVECKFASATGTYSQWTPSTGSANYINVDEATPNDDTDYNSASGTALADTFNFSDLSTVSGQVFGVQRLLYARKDDAGSRSIAALHRNNNINSTGTVLSLGNTYAYYSDILELDPSITGSWTISNFNSSEWGYEMIS